MTSRISYNNPQTIGNFGLSYHYEMLSDEKRLRPFITAIERVAKNSVVIESGTGSGVQSILAARAGAKHVFAIEIDPTVAAFASENIKRSGLDNITLINKSSLEVSIDDLRGLQADVIIAENLSTWQVTEPQVEIMNHLRSHVAKKDAIYLPTIIENKVELGSAQYCFYDSIELRAHYFEFSGIQAPQLLSAPCVYSRFDFREAVAEKYDHAIDLKVNQTGVLNCIRLTSPLEIYDDITFDSSDSLMPPVVIPLDEDLEVDNGDSVRIAIEYSCNSEWESFRCHASVL